MLDQLINTLIELAFFFALTAVTIICAYVRKYLDSLSKKVNAEEERELYKAAIDEVDRLTKTIVISLEQEKGQEIKQKIKDSEAVRHNLLDLKNEAVAKILETLRPDYKMILKTHMRYLECYLEDCIENQVYKLKNGLK